MSSRCRAKRARSRSPRRRPCNRWRATNACANGWRSWSPRWTRAKSAADSAELLESVLELGLQTGRIRAYYGPGGEQAALSTLRKLPRGRVRTDTARDVSAALQALAGARLDSSQDHRRRSRRVQPRDRSRRRSGLGSPGRERRPSDEPRDVSDTRYFMACLDLRGRDCLVVGGGRVATEKVHGLLDCEASVTVVAPLVADELRRLPVRFERRGFERADVDGRVLVIAATDDRRVNGAVSRRCRRAIDALQRRGRPGALQLHPPRDRAPRPDRRRRLDRRRLPGPRATHPLRHRGSRRP